MKDHYTITELALRYPELKKIAEYKYYVRGTTFTEYVFQDPKTGREWTGTTFCMRPS